jgi:hypothetical protein
MANVRAKLSHYSWYMNWDQNAQREKVLENNMHAAKLER